MVADFQCYPLTPLSGPGAYSPVSKESDLSSLT